MNPILREFALSLPFDVRRELAKCEGPFWLVARYSTHDVHLLCREAGEATERDAWLPVSPNAIAKHAARLAGAIGYAVETFADRTTASVRRRVSDVKPGGKLSTSVHYDDDPTGHLAALALLKKVMAEVASC